MPGDANHAATSTTVDRYLETIYCIAGEGETVRPGRLAAWLGVAAPTVSDAVQRLARDGWVDVATDRSVTLTADGERAAAALVRCGARDPAGFERGEARRRLVARGAAIAGIDDDPHPLDGQ